MPKYTDEYYKIRIQDLQNAGVLETMSAGSMQIQLPQYDEFENPEYIQAYVIPCKNYIEINFMGTSWTERIHVIFTEPNYGGKRPWFLCPLNGEKCTILHSYRYGLASRKGLNLKYRSKRIPHIFRYLDTLDSCREELKKIKYPYRNGKPTRKFKRIIRKYKNIGYDEQRVEEDYMFSKMDL